MKVNELSEKLYDFKHRYHGSICESPQILISMHPDEYMTLLLDPDILHQMHAQGENKIILGCKVLVSRDVDGVLISCIPWGNDK